MFKISRAAWPTAFAALLLLSTARGEEVAATLSASATDIAYQHSLIRDRGREHGIDFGASIGDFGVRAVYGKSIVKYFGSPALDQDSYFVSGVYAFNLRDAQAKVLGGLNLYYVNNNDATRTTDVVNVIEPRLAYVAEEGRLRLELGYARSSYPYGLRVDQWSPGIMLGLNDGSDVAQLRGTYIDVSTSSPAQTKTHAASLEATWTHYLEQGDVFKPRSITLSAMFGERVYAVNSDAGSVGNLADVQKGAFSLTGQWNLPGRWILTGILGEQRFQEKILSVPNGYALRFLFVSVAKQW